MLTDFLRFRMAHQGRLALSASVPTMHPLASLMSHVSPVMVPAALAEVLPSARLVMVSTCLINFRAPKFLLWLVFPRLSPFKEWLSAKANVTAAVILMMCRLILSRNSSTNSGQPSTSLVRSVAVSRPQFLSIRPVKILRGQS